MKREDGRRKKIKIMSEELNVTVGTKQDQYESILPQIKSVVDAETDLIANLANVCACLNEQFGWLWVGFYLVKDGELVLGPFQGPLACTRIKRGHGVCGTSWDNHETIIVPDVNAFPGHIACSSKSLSEIVVPVIRNGMVLAVLDVDSDQYNAFDETDKKYLEAMINFLVF